MFARARSVAIARVAVCDRARVASPSSHRRDGSRRGVVARAPRATPPIARGDDRGA